MKPMINRRGFFSQVCSAVAVTLLASCANKSNKDIKPLQRIDESISPPTESAVPTRAYELIASDKKIANLTTNGKSTLAVTAEGRIIGWGKNFWQAIPTIDIAEEFIAASLGTSHIAAFTKSGDVKCWGAENRGQQVIPAAAQNTVALCTGEDFTVALSSLGSVVVWGKDDFFQTRVPDTAVNVVAIGAGVGHVLALTKEGRVIAWGANHSGQCNVPADLSDVVAIDASGNYSSAVTSEGKLIHWGEKSRIDQLNIIRKGANDDDSAVPFGEKTAISSKKILSTFNGTTAVLTGRNNISILWGDDNEQTEIHVAERVISIAAGNKLVFALYDNGRVEAHHLANYSPRFRTRKNATLGFDDSKRYSKVAAGDDFFLGVSESNEISVWGINQSNLADTWSIRGKVGELSCGQSSMLVLSDEGVVSAYEQNNEAYIANIPENIPRLVSVDVGERHAVGISEDGALIVWGEPYVLRRSEIHAPYLRVSAYKSITAALSADGNIYTWDQNYRLWNPWKCPIDANQVKSISCEFTRCAVLSNSGDLYICGEGINAPTALPEVLQACASAGYTVALMKGGNLVIRGIYNELPSDFYGINDFVQIDLDTENLIGLRKDGTAVFGFIGDYADVPFFYRA